VEYPFKKVSSGIWIAVVNDAQSQ